jgi:hypothetical protein
MGRDAEPDAVLFGRPGGKEGAKPLDRGDLSGADAKALEKAGPTKRAGSEGVEGGVWWVSTIGGLNMGGLTIGGLAASIGGGLSRT